MSIVSATARKTTHWPKATGTKTPVAWKRNPTWATLPSVSGLQKFAGLYAVFPESPFIAFTVSAAYTVDWGDGNTENFATGVTAYHQYSFADSDLSNTDGPVTFQDSGDTVTRIAHGYGNGDAVSFATINATTGISVASPYFVISATADTFQVATAPGGSAVVMTTDGSGTLLPYKQAIVTITPQTANNLTAINLNVKHNQTGLNQYASGWLDISIEGANLTTLTISTSGTRNIEHRLLEQFSLTGSNSITSASGLFYNCRRLISLLSLSLASCATFSNTFTGCSSLASVSALNTAAGTNFSNMFNGCSSLTGIPLLNTAAGTNFSSMFNGCSSLAVMPLLNTAAGTSFASMFFNCFALTGIPLLNTAAGTSFASMFFNCFALTGIPLLNTAAGTSFASMFYGCSSLAVMPLLNTAPGTDFSNMFYGCSSLASVPLLNTAAGTNFSAMFNGCSALGGVPLLNTSACTNFSYMFYGCSSLTGIPLLNTGTGTDFSYMFYGCSSLTGIPLLNTAAGTSFARMCYNCFALAVMPLLNTAAGTDFSYMFYGCSSLASVPAINVGSASSSSSYTSFFTGCASIERIDAVGFKYTFTVVSCKLSAAALDALYGNLASVSGQTITVSSNWGTASDTPSIATAKGWTVSG